MGVCKNCRKEIPEDPDDSSGFCNQDCWIEWVKKDMVAVEDSRWRIVEEDYETKT